MNQDQKEKAYQGHVRHDDERGYNVDGCFYCGGAHPSDCCGSSDRDEYWAEDDDAPSYACPDGCRCLACYSNSFGPPSGA